MRVPFIEIYGESHIDYMQIKMIKCFMKGLNFKKHFLRFLKQLVVTVLSESLSYHPIFFKNAILFH